jgi:hypothetical protein
MHEPGARRGVKGWSADPYNSSLGRWAAKGHFETKLDACHCASIGLILLQELTFWRSATKVGAGSSCTFHAASPNLVKFGSSP